MIVMLVIVIVIVIVIVLVNVNVRRRRPTMGVVMRVIPMRVITVVLVPLVPHVYLRLKIRAAANAAPNPLSMFTTVTPDAQLVSIPRSAASP